MLYFLWADQRDKCALFSISATVLYGKKHSYEVNMLLFLFHSPFIKVIIAFLHTSITLKLIDGYECSCSYMHFLQWQ